MEPQALVQHLVQLPAALAVTQTLPRMLDCSMAGREAQRARRSGLMLPDTVLDHIFVCLADSLEPGGP